MQIFGGTSTVNTLSFSQPVVDPVLAIWSLGSVVQGPASFVFTGFNPQNIVGGPSPEYGGSPLNLSGVTVSGIEGNGSIQFLALTPASPGPIRNLKTTTDSTWEFRGLCRNRVRSCSRSFPSWV